MNISAGWSGWKPCYKREHLIEAAAEMGKSLEREQDFYELLSDMNEAFIVSRDARAARASLIPLPYIERR